MSDHKMLVMCPCGTKLRVSMAQYAKLRCPKCQLMLGEEIERQAARNSKAILDIGAVILHERMTAKKWTVNDEKIALLLSKHEVESCGGEWPPKMADRDDDPMPVFVPSAPEVHTSPLQQDVVVPTPAAPPKRNKDTGTTSKIKVKLKRKKGRR